MPDKNFKDVLSADFKQNFTIISVEEQPALHMVDYIEETLQNHTAESAKYDVHLLLFAHNVNIFDFNESSPHVFVHDYVFNELESLEILFEKLVKNKCSSESYKDVLILDDFCMFLIMGASRVLPNPITFLRKLKVHFTKIIVFLNKETVSLHEAATLYDTAEALAIVRASTKPRLFTCDLIKTKAAVGAKVRHEQSFFEVVNGVVKVSVIQKDNLQSTSNSDDVLRNLTTFKLTLEEDEKESKSRLHLPYFDAQKTSVNDTSVDDYFDDDEEEEEP